MGRNYNDENGERRQRRTATSSNSTDKLTYLLVGGGIGALVALLFAPKAGQELRSDIADATRKGYDKTLETAQQLKEQSGTYYQQIKGQAGEVYNSAADRLRGSARQTEDITQNAVNKTLSAARESGNQVADAAKQTTAVVGGDNQMPEHRSA